LFGFADAVGLRLQGQGLPNQLTDIAPYVVTLAALAISHRKRARVAVVSAEALQAAPGAVDPA
jgi:simple sugar transport system permease protein